MIKKELIKNITDLRQDPISLFHFARKKEGPVFVFNRAEPLGVLLSWEDFEIFMERLEDKSDIAELREARASSSKLVPWHKMKQTLNV